MNGFIFAIGDIHGHCSKLERLLVKLSAYGLDPEDTLVFLGDYVDRGPDTRGTIETLIGLQQAHANCVFLRGNHEQMMLDARARFDPEWPGNAAPDTLDRDVNWFAIGGAQTLGSYRAPGQTSGQRWWDLIPAPHWEFIAGTEIEFVTERFRFVHAGVVPPGEEWEFAGSNVDPRLWIREPFLSSRADFGQIVVFGHTPIRSGSPILEKNKIGLDTAAAYGGPLTAIRIDPDLPYHPSQLRVFQVE